MNVCFGEGGGEAKACEGVACGAGALGVPERGRLCTRVSPDEWGGGGD